VVLLFCSWDKHKGNLYTFGPGQYLGTPSAKWIAVNQSKGDGNTTDYSNFFDLLNSYCFITVLIKILANCEGLFSTFSSKSIAEPKFCLCSAKFSVAALSKVFNIDRFLRQTVVEVFIDYGDGYI
jgi:hypothetical protein